MQAMELTFESNVPCTITLIKVILKRYFFFGLQRYVQTSVSDIILKPPQVNHDTKKNLKKLHTCYVMRPVKTCFSQLHALIFRLLVYI